MKVYSLFTTVMIGLSTVSVSAYTFTFKNNLDLPVTVAMQLVGINEDHHTKEAPAKGQVSFTFDGLRVGFCLNSNTVKVTKQGGSEVALPVLFVLSKNPYDQIMNDVRTTGKTTMPMGSMPNKFPNVCRSQVFDIVADANGNPRVIMLY